MKSIMNQLEILNVIRMGKNFKTMKKTVLILAAVATIGMVSCTSETNEVTTNENARELLPDPDANLNNEPVTDSTEVGIDSTDADVIPTEPEVEPELEKGDH